MAHINISFPCTSLNILINCWMCVETAPYHAFKFQCFSDKELKTVICG